MIKSTMFVAKYCIKMIKKDGFMQVFCVFVSINAKKTHNKGCKKLLIMA